MLALFSAAFSGVQSGPVQQQILQLRSPGRRYARSKTCQRHFAGGAKFKDCTFDSDKKPEYLRTWLRLLSGIVRNIPHGKQIENFLDGYLQRRLNEATTGGEF